MKKFFFSIFKILKKIESFLALRGLRRIPGIIFLYHRAWLPLCDLLYDKVRPKGIILLTNIQGNKIYVNTNDKSISARLLMEGRIEKYETELFKKIVKKGMVVVDIGANIGYYTLIAAKLVGENGIVYSFEPEPNSHKFLCKNVEINNYTNVVPIKKAVSNKNGEVNLWFEKERIANPSFSKKNVLTHSTHKTLKKGGFIEVETTTLDKFFENAIGNNKINIIKIDVEGAEGLVIEGAEKILRNNNLKIFMEFWPEGLRNLGTNPLELLQKLQKYGFKMKFINERKQALEPIEIFQFYKKTKSLMGLNLLLEK